MRLGETTINNQIEREYLTPIESSAKTLTDQYRFCRYNDQVMIEKHEPYGHFVPMPKERFEEIAYTLLGGISRSRLNDVFEYLISTVPDLSHNNRFILFGNLADSKKHVTVWDTNGLKLRGDVLSEDCVFRSPCPVKSHTLTTNSKPLPFIMSLAGGDQGLYDDIMQSLAPIIMKRKPDGVIWWVGDNTDGKTLLMDALHRIFPGLLSDISIQRLIVGRNVLALNDKLGNIAECGNNQIEDAEVYKNIGSHQSFQVHKFHSQRSIEIRGNTHHIFIAKAAPIFKTKNLSIQRRTHVISFHEQAHSRPHKLTDNFFGQMVAEMCRYAVRLKQQGYCYNWSEATLAESDGYDAESSPKETALVSSNSSPLEFRW